MEGDYEDIKVKFISCTPKAVLIEVNGDREWIPLSQIEDCDQDIDSCERGDMITITIPEWLAEDKGLI